VRHVCVYTREAVGEGRTTCGVGSCYTPGVTVWMLAPLVVVHPGGGCHSHMCASRWESLSPVCAWRVGVVTPMRLARPGASNAARCGATWWKRQIGTEPKESLIIHLIIDFSCGKSCCYKHCARGNILTLFDVGWKARQSVQNEH
jgi:hypothetical protein